MTSARDDDHAARWAVRLDGEPLSPREQAELDGWLEADERRRGALLRAEAALAYLDRGRALVAPGDAVVTEGGTGRVLPLRDRRRFLIGGGAMAAIAASGLLVMVLRPAPPVDVRTAIGEIRRVPLADGSVAAVNTDTDLTVAVASPGRQRDVMLERGEAWFKVAHDKTRPFVVAAGDVRVQAVGTAFSVRRRDRGVDVLVTEGVVETWVVGRERDRTRIAAGSKSFVADSSPAIEVVAAPADIDRQLSWRTGELALNGESLAHAVAELNRYNVRKIVVEDQALGRTPLIGYFRTDQPENFGRTIAAMKGARVHVEGDTIRLSSPN
ncbi:FecR family protein [Sphingomonas sp. CLY1604]|uniref:FecR family protein n=1 Tax=Sphingomonas sp. CLY1604 TaxID=3457786 RepID=UPI003FD6E042